MKYFDKGAKELQELEEILERLRLPEERLAKITRLD